MNQRTANRSRHATVLCRQLVERRNGGRVAKDNGNLPTLLAKNGLTLGACLGGAHSEQAELTAAHVGNDDDRLGADGKHRVLQHAGITLVHGCGNRGGVVVVHGLLRSGPIPPMGESYAVTSDNARGIYK